MFLAFIFREHPNEAEADWRSALLSLAAVILFAAVVWFVDWLRERWRR